MMLVSSRMNQTCQPTTQVDLSVDSQEVDYRGT